MGCAKNIGTVKILRENLDAACKAVSDGFEYCGWEIEDVKSLEYLLNELGFECYMDGERELLIADFDDPLNFDLKSLFSCLAPFLEGQHISFLDTEWFSIEIFTFEGGVLEVEEHDIDHVVDAFVKSRKLARVGETE